LQAEKSVPEKMEERYRDTVDEYHNFINDFPDSKYAKEAQQMFEKSQKKLN
jgi:outer membrane protein assembly factor BamD